MPDTALQEWRCLNCGARTRSEERPACPVDSSHKRCVPVRGGCAPGEAPGTDQERLAQAYEALSTLKGEYDELLERFGEASGNAARWEQRCEQALDQAKALNVEGDAEEIARLTKLIGTISDARDRVMARLTLWKGLALGGSAIGFVLGYLVRG